MTNNQSPRAGDGKTLSVEAQRDLLKRLRHYGDNDRDAACALIEQLGADLYAAEGRADRLANELASSRGCVSEWVTFGSNVTEALGLQVMSPKAILATIEGLRQAVAAGFPIVSRWTMGAKDAGPRARLWVQFEDGGTEVEFAAAPAAAPAALKPLTDYQIVRIYERPELAGTRHESGTEKAIAIARAIEAAHGIQAPCHWRCRMSDCFDRGCNGCDACIDDDEAPAKLLPCPFCGGEPRVSVAMDEDIWSHNTVPWTLIRCGDCDANTSSICEGDSPTAHERWNSRAGLDAIQTDAYAEGRKDEQAELASVLPGAYYMDPPDGGSVTVLEQLQRMAKDAERWRERRESALQEFAMEAAQNTRLMDAIAPILEAGHMNQEDLARLRAVYESIIPFDAPLPADVPYPPSLDNVTIYNPYGPMSMDPTDGQPVEHYWDREGLRDYGARCIVWAAANFQAPGAAPGGQP